MPKPIQVNTVAARGATSVIQYCLSLRPKDFVEQRGNATKGRIVWSFDSSDFENLSKVKESQCVSRVPGFSEACHKVDLVRALRDLVDKDSSDEEEDSTEPTNDKQEEESSFWPKTWIVPEETKDILKMLKQKSKRKAGSRKTYIFKPDAASQGDGISLLQTSEDLKRLVEGLGLGCDAVVQEYVDKPLLLDNCKFDLRLYVLVLGSGCSPRVFVCREGLARVCVQEYEAPAPKNLHKVGTHLTNYSINSKDAGFDRSAEGNKRLMSTVLAKLAEEGSINEEALWKQMLNSIAITVQAMAENTHNTAGSTEESSGDSDSGTDGDLGSNSAQPSKKFFHVLGFDLILDGDGRPILLEVNARPSLKIDSVYPLEQPSVAELKARAEERRRRAGAGEDRFANADKLQFLPGQDTPGPGSYQIDKYLKHAGGNGSAEKGSMGKTRIPGPDSRPQQSPQCPPKSTAKAEATVCNGKEEGAPDSKEQPINRMDSGKFGPWSRCNSGMSDAEGITIESGDKFRSCGSDQYYVDADDAELHGPVTPFADEVPDEHSAACLFCSEDGKYSLTPEAEEAWNKVYLKGSVRPTWFEMQASTPGKIESSFRQDLEVPPPAAPTKLKVCKCMSHYKPHLHIPSIVDLTAKGQAILGALDIVKKWLSKDDFELDNLTHGTAYEEVFLQS